MQSEAQLLNEILDEIIIPTSLPVNPTLLTSLFNEYNTNLQTASTHIQTYNRIGILSPIYTGRFDIFDYIIKDIEKIVKSKQDATVIVIERTELREDIFIERLNRVVNELECLFVFGNEKSVWYITGVLNGIKAFERIKIVTLFE